MPGMTSDKFPNGIMVRSHHFTCGAVRGAGRRIMARRNKGVPPTEAGSVANVELLECALKKCLGVQYAPPRQSDYFGGDDLVERVIPIRKPKPVLDAQQ